MCEHERVYPQTRRELVDQRNRLAPAQAEAFRVFSQSVFAEGAIPANTKQLIAVAVAHVTQCPYCIRGHTRAALRHGTTPEEIMEAIWVAAEMRAGAAYAHSALALETIADAEGYAEKHHRKAAINPLLKLVELGQSVWYDYIRRDLYQAAELKRLIDEDGLRGMTSNPTLFAKAITETELYDEDIRRLAAKGKSAAAIFEALEVEDVRRAADTFRPVYESTGGDDGFVSIEVRPQLARDTQGSIVEARRLWTACDRPNVMVKIPATGEGIPAIRQCLAEGININITLLFSVPRYREVMEAYLAAMEERVAAAQPVDRIRSVASFFVSRVDTNADKKLDGIANDASHADRERRSARDLRGKVAIANARIAYQAFSEIFEGQRFAQLHEKGVRLQRPLWASTSTKDPALSDIYYVEALIAPNSVNTMPPETFRAYKDHGDPQIRIHDDLPGAHSVFHQLRDLNIDEKQISQELEDEGARKFVEFYDKVLGAIEEKKRMMKIA